MVDQLRDATGEESWISDMMFRDTVRALSARERRIIALRYLGGKTQTQVARKSASVRHRSAVWKRPRSAASKAQICSQ